MITLHFYGSKGGVQTSTIAALTALSHDAQVVLVDLPGDQLTIMGMACLPEPERHVSLADGIPINPHVMLVRTDIAFVSNVMVEASVAGYDLVVVDHGVAPLERRELGGTHIIVVQPDYLSVRRAVQRQPYDEWILTNPQTARGLSARDVINAMGSMPISEVAYEPAIARSLDAGLLVSASTPPRIKSQFDNLVNRIGANA